MWEELTQNQKWGFAYSAQCENDRNPSVNVTAQDMALRTLQQAGDSMFNGIRQRKIQMVIEMFDAKSPEEQQALLAQLGVPDVLRGA